MGTTYHPEPWHDIFVVLSTSSAALIGLLFIATSQHLHEIVNNPIFYRRAFSNTCYLLITLVEAVLLLVPQPMLTLGILVIAINVAGLYIPFGLT